MSMFWTSLMFSLLAYISSHTVTASTRCRKADVGFLLDASGSISDHMFQKEIKIVQGLARVFQVRYGGSRAGLVVFSNYAKTVIDFDMCPTVQEFNKELGKVTKFGGRTRIDLGIDESTLVLYNQRFKEKVLHEKLLFVLSDGKQSLINRKIPNLKRRTRFLKQQGVQIIVVAMGSTANIRVLNQLVQFPEYQVIHVRYHAKIPQMVRIIQRAACAPAPAVSTLCKRIADIAFLLDQSSSIGGPVNFRLETQFVKDVLDKYTGDGRPHEIRAGVIRYGEKAELMIKLNDFSNMKKLKAVIDRRVKFEGSKLTRIDLALRMANKQFFRKKNGDRPDAPNVLILITDGIQNSGNWRRDNVELVPYFARPLWRNNVTIIAVGVARARIAQLKKIAGPKGTVIYRKNLRGLTSAVEEITPVECPGCHSKVNLGFLMDVSATTRNSYTLIKKLVYYITEGYKSQRENLMASVTRFSEKAITDIQFGQFKDLSSFHIKIDTELAYMGGRTFIHRGLRAAKQEFDANSDKNSSKVLIILTDGLQSSVHSTLPMVKKAANEVRRSGIEICVIKVGPRCAMCKITLQAITGGAPGRIIRIKPSDNVLVKSEEIARLCCPNT